MKTVSCRRGAVCVIAACLALGATVQRAEAQWTAQSLHPANYAVSAANASVGDWQYGYTLSELGMGYRATLWRPGHGPMSLHPPGVMHSGVNGAFGAQAVGSAGTGNSQAFLWDGVTLEARSLHPNVAFSSLANATDGVQQVGKTFSHANDGRYRASVWEGTAESYVSLHPDFAWNSEALAVSGGFQAGWVDLPGVGRRASVWSGTAASWTDLNPAGASYSVAYAASGSMQGGMAYINEKYVASLWSGTADSWQSLQPQGAQSSELRGMSGMFQVGYVTTEGVQRAAVWNGSAESWFDLHQLLPSRFRTSEARSVSFDDQNIYVAGVGIRQTDGLEEAFLWTRPIPAPTSIGLLVGVAAMSGARRRRA